MKIIAEKKATLPMPGLQGRLSKQFHAFVLLLFVGILTGVATAQPIQVRAIFDAPKKEAKRNTEVTVRGWTNGTGPFDWSWKVRDDKGRLLKEEQHQRGSKIAPLKFFPSASGKYRVELAVIDDRNKRGQDTEIVDVPGTSTPTKPPVKPPVKPSLYHPLKGAQIFGPSKVKVGARASWEGLPDGGAKPWHFRWRIERGGNVLRVSDGNTSEGSTKISPSFKESGTVTITFLIWDDTSGRSKTQMAKKVVQVEAEEEDSSSSGAGSEESIAGWWLWVRDKDLVPVFINPKGSDGLYRGVYFPYLTLKTLRKTPDMSPSKLAFKKTSGNTYRYAWNYPGGAKGTGVMNWAGKRMQGTWERTDKPESGSWMWGRPNAEAKAKLEKHFGR